MPALWWCGGRIGALRTPMLREFRKIDARLGGAENETVEPFARVEGRIEEQSELQPFALVGHQQRTGNPAA